jgi:hypothetical protein
MKKVTFSPHVIYVEDDITTLDYFTLAKLSRIADNKVIPQSFLMRYDRLLAPIFGPNRLLIYEVRFKKE